MKMTLLDVIDLDKIWIVNLCEKKTNFVSHGRKWARLWFGIYEKIKIEKKHLNKANANH